MSVAAANDVNANGSSKRSRWGRIAAAAVTVLILAVLGVYLHRNQEAWRSLARARLSAIVALVLLWTLMSLIGGYMNCIMFRLFGVRLRFVEWFGLPVAQAMTSYVIPFRGGAAITAVYLKKQCGLAYSKFLACLLCVYALFLVSTGPVACLLLGAIALAGRRWHPGLFVFFLVFTAVSWVGWVLLPRIKWPGKRFGRIAASVHQGWLDLREDRRLTLKVVVLVWLLTGITGLRVYIAMRSLGVSYGILEACITGIVLRYSILFKIVPGNLGVHEGLVGIASKLFGYPPEMGVAAALLLRGVNVAMLFALGPIFAYVFTHRLATGPSPGAQAVRESESATP